MSPLLAFWIPCLAAAAALVVVMQAAGRIPGGVPLRGARAPDPQS